jgi:hypothetical protein
VGPPHIGTRAHRELFCQSFLDSYSDYDPARIAWPELTTEQFGLLANLPIWTQSVDVEHETAVIVRAMADHEPDPRIAEAIALQAFEEERHAELVSALTEHYGLGAGGHEPPRPAHIVHRFLWSGWGECLDSFFAFGFYGLARETGLVHQALLDTFDLVLHEEARHIVFFENWRRYRLSQAEGRASFLANSSAAAARTIGSRIAAVVSMSRRPGPTPENFLVGAAGNLGAFSLSALLDRCLTENERRLGSFDPGLAVPQLVPGLARRVRSVLPHDAGAHGRLGVAERGRS